MKNLTTKSAVLQWGELDFTSEPVADFQSNTDAQSTGFWGQLINDGLHMLDDALKLDDSHAERKNTFAVDSRDMKLHFFYNRVMKDPTPENHADLQAEIAHRLHVDSLFDKIFGSDHMENFYPLFSPFYC